MHTAVHNTLMIDDREQMTRAGRFLYLDRAQAEVLGREKAADGSWECLSARHDGYLKLGLIHSRRVTAHQDDRWVVEDLAQPVQDDVMTSLHEVRLHWLLPDWAWEIEKIEDLRMRLRLKSPHGWIDLNIFEATDDETFNHQSSINPLRGTHPWNRPRLTDSRLGFAYLRSETPCPFLCHPTNSKAAVEACQ